jgi:hypothetical protein
MIQAVKYPHRKVALKYVIRYPSLALAFFDITHRKCMTRCLTRISGRKDLNPELFSPPKYFMDYLQNLGYGNPSDYWLLLYALIRYYQPEIVLETGVGPNGASSAFILCAMHENSKGHLYSIDLPPWMANISDPVRRKDVVEYSLADGQLHRDDGSNQIGRLIPDSFKTRWTLVLGDSVTKLPVLLSDIGKLGFFFHDSLHTREQMKFEFETAWPRIDKDGFLISHDVIWNDAFLDFCNSVGGSPTIFGTLGFLKKSEST